jgi:acyl-CoA thioesterase
LTRGGFEEDLRDMKKDDSVYGGGGSISTDGQASLGKLTPSTYYKRIESPSLNALSSRNGSTTISNGAKSIEAMNPSENIDVFTDPKMGSQNSIADGISSHSSTIPQQIPPPPKTPKMTSLSKQNNSSPSNTLTRSGFEDELRDMKKDDSVHGGGGSISTDGQASLGKLTPSTYYKRMQSPSLNALSSRNGSTTISYGAKSIEAMNPSDYIDVFTDPKMGSQNSIADGISSHSSTIPQQIPPPPKTPKMTSLSKQNNSSPSNTLTRSGFEDELRDMKKDDSVHGGGGSISTDGQASLGKLTPSTYYKRMQSPSLNALSSRNGSTTISYGAKSIEAMNPSENIDVFTDPKMGSQNSIADGISSHSSTIPQQIPPPPKTPKMTSLSKQNNSSPSNTLTRSGFEDELRDMKKDDSVHGGGGSISTDGQASLGKLTPSTYYKRMQSPSLNALSSRNGSTTISYGAKSIEAMNPSDYIDVFTDPKMGSQNSIADGISSHSSTIPQQIPPPPKTPKMTSLSKQNNSSPSNTLTRSGFEDELRDMKKDDSVHGGGGSISTDGQASLGKLTPSTYYKRMQSPSLNALSSRNGSTTISYGAKSIEAMNPSENIDVFTDPKMGSQNSIADGMSSHSSVMPQQIPPPPKTPKMTSLRSH